MMRVRMGIDTGLDVCARLLLCCTQPVRANADSSRQAAICLAAHQQTPSDCV